MKRTEFNFYKLIIGIVYLMLIVLILITVFV